jgi:hypothetical protein
MVSEKFQEIKKIVEEIEIDVYKFEVKNIKSAGQRIRKNLQVVKEKSQEIRQLILAKRKL